MSAPLDFSILRQEDDWLWLLKPPGIPVFPPHANPDGDCVLRHLNNPGDWPDGFDGGIAHRLDVSTSGVVLAARSPDALARARAAFKEGRLRKSYRFLSDGQPTGPLHVTSPIAHHPRRRDRMVVQRGPRTRHRGKWYPADTTFRHLGSNRWEAVIVTGVMHQIRVHAASVGIPLLGDTIYGGSPWPAPQGVLFPLHHCRMDGLGGCPFSPPWF